MTDLFLKFESEAQANSVLYTQVPTAFAESGEAIEHESRPNHRNIDTIGIIYKPTGEMVTSDDGEGNVVSSPEMAPIEGWHVNVRLAEGEDGAALELFAVTPEQPTRVWG
jgi:hypothetical protein